MFVFEPELRDSRHSYNLMSLGPMIVEVGARSHTLENNLLFEFFNFSSIFNDFFFNFPAEFIALHLKH